MKVLIVLPIFIWFIISHTDGSSEKPLRRNLNPTGTFENSKVYPWLVSIRSNGKHICAGTIVSDNLALTASSCFRDLNDLVVRVSHGGSEHLVTEAIAIGTDNDVDINEMAISDVALVKVMPPFPCDSQAIDLARKGDVIAPGMNASVANWERVDQRGIANLRIVQCANNVSARHICASLLDETVGPGSYGGPLLVNGTQIGIIPRNFEFVDPKEPRLVVTSISNYRESIKSAVVNFDPHDIKIGGGIKTQLHPWLVSIKLNSMHPCDGTIISENVVLTAASCFGSDLPTSFTVWIDTTVPIISKYQVTDSKIHERYDLNDSSNMYDIALLKVSPSIRFNNSVYSIFLAHPLVVNPYVRSESCGLSFKILDGSSIDIRRIIGCPQNISDGHFCLEASNETVCQFTGGPLIKDGHLVGFKPKGRYCFFPNDTKVYNNALFYGKWIHENLQLLNLNGGSSSWWSSLWDSLWG